MWELRYPTTNLNIARHKKRCSVGRLYRTQCPNFSKKSQIDLNYHIAKKHSASKLDVTFKCKLFYPEFSGFYALRQHKNTQHGMQIGSGTKDVDVEHIVVDVGDQRLREELRSYRHFLVNSELERARNKVFMYAVETFNEAIVNEKLDHFFNNLKCAAKVNLAFDFILAKIEDGGSDTFTLTKTIPCWIDPNLCAHMTIGKFERFSQKTDVIESCSRETMNTKWRFYKLTNLTIFDVLPKDVHVRCEDAVLPELLLKNHTMNCLMFEENTR